MAEHTPGLFAILGIYPLKECAPTLALTGADGEPYTYYRAGSKHTWVLYKAAVAGHGEKSFHPEQR